MVTAGKLGIFVHVTDVVQANYKSALSIGVTGSFNVASAKITQMLWLAEEINKLIANPVNVFDEPRAGDLLDSLAGISKARRELGSEPKIDITQVIKDYIKWVKADLGI